jgi:hypothetical protein
MIGGGCLLLPLSRGAKRAGKIDIGHVKRLIRACTISTLNRSPPVCATQLAGYRAIGSWMRFRLSIMRESYERGQSYRCYSNVTLGFKPARVPWASEHCWGRRGWQ